MEWFKGWYEQEADEEDGIPLPFTMELTPNGKTMFFIFRNSDALQDLFIEHFGEPECIEWGETNPDCLILLFPHQNLPEAWKDTAERMTTSHLLEYLSSFGGLSEVEVNKAQFKEYLRKRYPEVSAFEIDSSMLCKLLACGWTDAREFNYVLWDPQKDELSFGRWTKH